MFLPKPAHLLRSLADLLETGTRYPQNTAEFEQLGQSIMEYGRMIHDLYACDPVPIEVEWVAHRLRESPAAVIAALFLLEKEGRAIHTSYKGLWKLRIWPDYRGQTERST
jgi:hypothetical protein